MIAFIGFVIANLSVAASQVKACRSSALSGAGSLFKAHCIFAANSSIHNMRCSTNAPRLFLDHVHCNALTTCSAQYETCVRCDWNERSYDKIEYLYVKQLGNCSKKALEGCCGHTTHFPIAKA